jgi:hypothetical protein
MRYFNSFFVFFFCLVFIGSVDAYPINGYAYTGIRRLLRLERILSGELKDAPILAGAQKTYEAIQLNLYGTERGDSLATFPEVDPGLQKALNALFPNLHESYSLALLDMTPGQPLRYAARQETRGFQPGSVGKLAVLSALFCELETLYPDSFSHRTALLKNTMVKAGPFGVYDEHTVPFYDPATGKFFKRQVQEADIFSLYEWADHMMSVSNNGAASIVWREAMLMRVFGNKYPELTFEEKMQYFKSTPKSDLSDIATSVVNDPLRSMGITDEEWKLGLMFTRGASNYVPGKGGSIGTPKGLMKYLIHLERGTFLDKESCLEMKRLMYMTDRRIRYAANESLKTAAVYFKSGSLYKCKPEEGFSCGKYKGNVNNFMNSVAIVEHENGRTYMVVLMSNVLRRNSNTDHNALAGRIDKLITL